MYLEDVLLPFVVSFFLVYLIRPVVNFISTPFDQCVCCSRKGYVTSRIARTSRKRYYAQLQESPTERDTSAVSPNPDMQMVDAKSKKVDAQAGDMRGVYDGKYLASDTMITPIADLASSSRVADSTFKQRKSHWSSSQNPPQSQSDPSRRFDGVPRSGVNSRTHSPLHTPLSRPMDGVVSRRTQHPHRKRQLLHRSQVTGGYPDASGVALTAPNAHEDFDSLRLDPHDSATKYTDDGNAFAAQDACENGIYRNYIKEEGEQCSSKKKQAKRRCFHRLRMTGCPRWFAIVVAVLLSVAILAGLVLMVVDAVQQFQQNDFGVFVAEANILVEKLQQWLFHLGISIETDAILSIIRQQISVGEVVQAAMMFLINGVGNCILIILVVLYLLAEQSSHSPDSLRAKVDDQIERYLGIKTIISASQGLLSYLFLGPLLHVRMAHLFGVLHFILNYIPTAGPIVATFLPLPVVLLDPYLSVTAKILAFAGPTAVHMVTGNIVEPLVFGSSMDLHPVTVLLALTMWYSLWGIPGAILAVPMTAVVRIFVASVDHSYARVLTCVLEGKLSDAMENVSSALEGNIVDTDDPDAQNTDLNNSLRRSSIHPMGDEVSISFSQGYENVTQDRTLYRGSDNWRQISSGSANGTVEMTNVLLPMDHLDLNNSTSSDSSDIFISFSQSVPSQVSDSEIVAESKSPPTHTRVSPTFTSSSLVGATEEQVVIVQ